MDRLQFEVNRAGGVPVYAQLARQVREALRLGWLKPGDRLPTVREVVASSRVNPNTVLKAYRLLESEGLVEGRIGAGTFVKASLGSAAPEAMAGCWCSARAGSPRRGRRAWKTTTSTHSSARCCRRRKRSRTREDQLAAIEVSGLSKRYRRRTALWDCTFSVPAGQVIALAGSNGAGKTTLLSILAGCLCRARAGC